MPAGLPGSTLVQNQANPTLGRFVVFDPLSGPKGSPLDAKKPDYAAVGPAPTPWVPDPGNISTGALSTGIGFSAGHVIGPTAPASIFAAGFDDNYAPGEKVTVYAAPPPPGVVTTDIVNSTMLYIGGGKMTMSGNVGNQVGAPTPYVAGVALAGAGNGGSRDGGAGPAFTGFPMKMVTATGAVANGAAIEAGFLNRSGLAMVAGQSAHGSDAAALAVPA